MRDFPAVSDANGMRQHELSILPSCARRYPGQPAPLPFLFSHHAEACSAAQKARLIGGPIKTADHFTLIISSSPSGIDTSDIASRTDVDFMFQNRALGEASASCGLLVELLQT